MEKPFFVEGENRINRILSTHINVSIERKQREAKKGE